MACLNIDKFSEICRLCLRLKKESETYLSVFSFKNEDGLNLMEQMNAMFFPLPDDIAPFLPENICPSCFQTFQSFSKYRENMNLLLQFLIGYVELKNGNRTNLYDLFIENRQEISNILSDLEVCHEDIQDIEEQATKNGGCAYEKNNIDSNFALHFAEVKEYEYSANENFVVEKDEEPVKPRSSSDNKSPAKPPPKKKTPQKITFKTDEEYLEDENVFEDYSYLDNESDYSEKIVTPKPRKRAKAKSSSAEPKPKKSYYKKTTTFVCKFRGCGVRFPTKDELEKHKKDDHSRYICDFCGMSLKKKYNLELHLNRHTGDTKFPCKFCNASYFTEGELKLHTEAIHIIKEAFICTICNLPQKSKRALNRHYNFHSSERNFKCDKCPLTFKTGGHLKRHCDDVHRAVRYNCEHCDMGYGRKDKLRMHVEKAHGIQMYFNCDICLKSFQTKDKLDEHKEMHKNPKEFECGVCLLAHQTKEEFDKHLCINYQDNYICCDRDFRYHFYYNKHMFLAHGVKINARVKPVANVLTGCARAKRKYIPRCPKCDRTFSTRKQKYDHVQICGVVEGMN